jgi:hypothetical protein
MNVKLFCQPIIDCTINHEVINQTVLLNVTTVSVSHESAIRPVGLGSWARFIQRFDFLEIQSELILMNSAAMETYMEILVRQQSQS